MSQVMAYGNVNPRAEMHRKASSAQVKNAGNDSSSTKDGAGIHFLCLTQLLRFDVRSFSFLKALA
jgi:hypothetical protein